MYVEFEHGGSFGEDIKFVNSIDEARARAEKIVEAHAVEHGRVVTHAKVSRADIFHGDENLDWYLIYSYDGNDWTESNQLRQE